MSETKNELKEAKNKDNQSELNTLMNNTNDNDIDRASQKDTQVYEKEYDEENFKDGQITAGLIYLLSIITGIVGPLIAWLVGRTNSNFVDRTGKNYINFTISYFLHGVCIIILYLIVSSILSIAGSKPEYVLGLASVALLVIAFLYGVFTIVGMYKGFKGQDYLPPLSYKILK